MKKLYLTIYLIVSCTPIHYEYYHLPGGFIYKGNESKCNGNFSLKTFSHTKCFRIFENKNDGFVEFMDELTKINKINEICNSHYDWNRDYIKEEDCLTGRGAYVE